MRKTPVTPTSDRSGDPSVADARSIRSLLAGYWSFGQFWGVWVILVFEFQRHHGISNARIGLDYTLLSVVALVAMLVGAPRLRSLPFSLTVPLALASMSIGTLAIAFLPTSTILIGFALLGVGNAMVDVFLNVAGHRTEVRTRRPVLQWMHATYALGGITGALVAGTLRAAGIDFRVGLAYVAAAFVFTTAWTAMVVPRERNPQGVQTLLSISALIRSPMLLIPALVVLSAFLIEGSMDAWAGLYVREQLGGSATVAALAFVAFAGSIFVGRLFAGRVLFGIGKRTTIVVAGAGSLIGGLIAVVANGPLVVAIGFLVLGFSLSAAAPAAFGLAGEASSDPTSAITAVTTVGYTGFVWSPPLLGWVAQTFGLRAAMGVIVIATLGIIGGGLLAPRDDSA
jgi:MFS family permease